MQAVRAIEGQARGVAAVLEAVLALLLGLVFFGKGAGGAGAPSCVYKAKVSAMTLYRKARARLAKRGWCGGEAVESTAPWARRAPGFRLGKAERAFGGAQGLPCVGLPRPGLPWVGRGFMDSRLRSAGASAMTDATLPVLVAALYKFTPFDDRPAVQARLQEACAAHGICGTLLVAHEGLNGTIAGAPEGIEAVLEVIRALPGCADIEVKTSRAPEMPFKRMKVRLKKEIVTMGVEDIDPRQIVGTYVPAEQWNELIARPDVVLIDTRNDYEVEIGTFEGAINPKTDTFRQFPAWFEAFSRELEAKGEKPKIAMFCTGGIRCEKATAYVKQQGFDEVFHLEGGILKYLETVKETESRWQGECFVFDERVAVDHSLKPGRHVMCQACGKPHADTLPACPHCTGEDAAAAG